MDSWLLRLRMADGECGMRLVITAMGDTATELGPTTMAIPHGNLSLRRCNWLGRATSLMCAVK